MAPGNQSVITFPFAGMGEKPSPLGAGSSGLVVLWDTTARRLACRQENIEGSPGNSGRHLWTRGSFVPGSGNVTDDVMARYIEMQDKMERAKDDSFSIGDDAWSRLAADSRSHRRSGGGAFTRQSADRAAHNAGPNKLSMEAAIPDHWESGGNDESQ